MNTFKKVFLYSALFAVSLASTQAYAFRGEEGNFHEGNFHGGTNVNARGVQYHQESQRTTNEALIQQQYNKNGGYNHTNVNGVNQNPTAPVYVAPVVPVQ